MSTLPPHRHGGAEPAGTLAGSAVVATSWRHRMPLDSVDADLLDAFVTGHVDRAPDLAPCP